jgi:hypothetical protein
LRAFYDQLHRRALQKAKNKKQNQISIIIQKLLLTRKYIDFYTNQKAVVGLYIFYI